MAGRVTQDHQHFVSDIIENENPHTPINPSGGVSLDPGDGTPVPVSTLVAPGAVIAGDTATLLIPQVIGPFTVLGTDAALAADWVLQAALVEGTMVVELRVFASEDFVGTGRLQIWAGNPNTASGITIWSAGTNPGPTGIGGVIAAPSQPSTNYLSTGGGSALVGANAGLYATIDSQGSAGIAAIYAIIATPAS